MGAWVYSLSYYPQRFLPGLLFTEVVNFRNVGRTLSLFWPIFSGNFSNKNFNEGFILPLWREKIFLLAIYVKILICWWNNSLSPIQRTYLVTVFATFPLRLHYQILSPNTVIFTLFLEYLYSRVMINLLHFDGSLANFNPMKPPSSLSRFFRKFLPFSHLSPP